MALRASNTEVAIAPWETGLQYGMWDARSFNGVDGDLAATLPAARDTFRTDLTASGAGRPFYRAGLNGINGRATYRYNDQSANHTANVAVADSLAASFSGSDIPCWMLAVGTIESALAQGTIFGLGRSSSSNSRHGFPIDSIDRFRLVRADDTAAASTPTGSKVLATSAPYVWGCRFLGTTADLWQQGLQMRPELTCDVGTATFNQFSVAATRRVATNQYLNGKLSLLIVGLGIPSPRQMRGMSVWAGREFGIAVV